MQKKDIYSFRKIVVYTPPQKKWYIVHRKKNSGPEFIEKDVAHGPSKKHGI